MLWESFWGLTSDVKLFHESIIKIIMEFFSLHFSNFFKGFQGCFIYSSKIKAGGGFERQPPQKNQTQSQIPQSNDNILLSRNNSPILPMGSTEWMLNGKRNSGKEMRSSWLWNTLSAREVPWTEPSKQNPFGRLLRFSGCLEFELLSCRCAKWTFN